jgi:hypothetical protein
MADDLRERIERGDLRAFADPALPLHLMVEPTAAWWRRGCARAFDHLASRLGWPNPRASEWAWREDAETAVLVDTLRQRLALDAQRPEPLGRPLRFQTEPDDASVTAALVTEFLPSLRLTWVDRDGHRQVTEVWQSMVRAVVESRLSPAERIAAEWIARGLERYAGG